ncbi:hypothetical protein M2145_002904 [Lachnospiraceae bacterium PF1-21]
MTMLKISTFFISSYDFYLIFLYFTYLYILTKIRHINTPMNTFTNCSHYSLFAHFHYFLQLFPHTHNTLSANKNSHCKRCFIYALLIFLKTGINTHTKYNKIYTPNTPSVIIDKYLLAGYIERFTSKTLTVLPIILLMAYC